LLNGRTITIGSPYAATKAGADRLAYAYYVTYGLRGLSGCSSSIGSDWAVP
jgi:dTDP-D-glucose 4,6-dehydratase